VASSRFFRQSGAGFDHGFHQFEGIQISAESRFCVGHQGSEPIYFVPAFGMMDLVRAEEGLVQAAHKIRVAIGGIQTLVRIHLRGVVGIGGNLPAADLNHLQTRGDLLYGLVPRHRAQRGFVFHSASRFSSLLLLLGNSGCLANRKITNQFRKRTTRLHAPHTTSWIPSWDKAKSGDLRPRALSASCHNQSLGSRLGVRSSIKS
jgi:hypothetical protein